MKIYFYFDHREKWKGSLMAKIEAQTILEADKQFKTQTGFDPIKCSWIQCHIELTN